MTTPQQQKTQKVIKIIKVLIACNIILSLILIYFFLHEKVPAYGAVYKHKGKNYLIKMVPLKKPIINSQNLLQWAGEAAVAAYTYDVANYKKEFEEVAQEYFTQEGGEAFLTALEDSGAIDRLVSEKLVVTSVVNGTPLLLKEGIILGDKVWRVQVPILVNFQSASEVRTEFYIVSMLIKSVPPNIKASGIGISQFKVSRGV